VGAENPVTSCDLQVFVYEAVDPVSLQWPDCRTGVWGSAAGGWVLIEGSMGTVGVVVLDVFA
jgi:hypothetical protein